MIKLDPALLAELRKLDTPTVCNALEVVAPERRGYGFTTRPLVCVRPQLPAMVGYARTATIRAAHPASRDGKAMRAHMDAYYAYVAEGGQHPSMMLIQDLDGAQHGYGSFWGEVNSHLHRGLGAVGCVTDGSVRDLNDIAPDFQILADRVGPSHAFVHVVTFGLPVNVSGMGATHDDLIHADQHGAVVIPIEVAEKVTVAAAAIARRERVLINASKEPGFDLQRLRKAIAESSEIH